MSAANCFRAPPRAYDLSSASARADCASLRFLSRQIVDVSLEQPLKVLNLFLLFDRRHQLALTSTRRFNG
jgi:hypothetical protein